MSSGSAPQAPGPEDWDNLRRYVVAQGADAEEVAEASDTGTLGALALDLALRPPGEMIPFEEAAAGAGLSMEDAAALWRALGFAVPEESSLRLTTAEAEMLRFLAQFGTQVVGEERALGFARVMGWATSVLGEALVDGFRVQTEVPRRAAGEPYAEVVEDYVQMASVGFPQFVSVLGVLLRAHMLRVARGVWVADEQQAAITREQTVGFADLVGYTDRSRVLSSAELVAAVGEFETRVADMVSQAGGRLVKFIGDEAMFVLDDPGAACRLAAELARSFEADPTLPPVRVGLAAGPVVAVHGDYYGNVVNLAARLVKVADPSRVLVSESVREAAGDGAGFEPVPEQALKGFDAPVAAFVLAG